MSGGGRCNITNSFGNINSLQSVYPRGHRLMKRLLKGFSPTDACQWWEQHGVRLTVQDDGCVFPQSQDSAQVVDCLLHHARRLGVQVVTGRRISSLDELSAYDAVCVATGGLTAATRALVADYVDVIDPCPSLFSLAVDDVSLHGLSGLVLPVSVRLSGTSFAADGPLLITHWGLSGPAVLRLSGYAARHLYDAGYRATIAVNWLQMNAEQASALVTQLIADNPKRQITNVHPAALPGRLWLHLLHRAGIAPQGKMKIGRLVETLVNDQYVVSGRAPFRDEFVTSGGVSLASVDAHTLAAKSRPNLFFAGEVLDIDGVTGGFNFQCAWTTAMTVATALTSS